MPAGMPNGGGEAISMSRKGIRNSHAISKTSQEARPGLQNLPQWRNY